MKSLFNDNDRRSIEERIGRVAAESRPQWGKMNSEMMLAHLSESLRMAIGELPVKPKKLLLRYFPLKQIVIYWLPFPKGVPTAPELLPSDRRTVEASKSQLARLLSDLAARRSEALWPEHPAFGKLTGRAWAVLQYRHFDHHLRQFGV